MASPIYSTLFKRNSIFVSTVFLSAFTFSIGFDLITTSFWDYHNRGKQWKDIRSKYIEAADE